MSVEIPKVAIAFGTVTPPQGDIIDLRVHLGCTKEVSSFECTLQNWNKKYSPSDTSPINVGMDGHMDVGRGDNVPQIITCRVEEIKCESTPAENYIRVSGRCWAEKLFRRVVTKTYENQKGEAIVKDLLDNYVGLSHVRDSTELVENTDTTYTRLKYDNTPVWDIIKYVAESSDKAGVIGYDFRLAPDGKFEFFPKNSKASPASLTDKIEASEYRKDIHRIRNRIIVNGLADKSVPLDKDAWTESLTPPDGSWSAGAGEVSLDTSFKLRGFASIKVHAPSLYWAGAMFTLNSGKEVNTNKYSILSFYTHLQKSYDGNVSITLCDTADKQVSKQITVAPGEWRKTDLNAGLVNEDEWETLDAGFDWAQVKEVRVACWFAGVGSGDFWIDSFYFGGCRYEAMREDTQSQSGYGLRELVEVDEELVSDNECDLRAKALLDYFKAPAEYLQLSTTVLDYGTAPLLPGDKIHVVLPNENVDGDFRIETVEYHVDAKTQTLEVSLELGKVPPLLADYLYGLRATTVTVEKLARTKLGKRGLPSPVSGGGLGAHHVGHEAGNNDGVEWATEDDGGWDKISGWIAPRFVGPFDDATAMVQFRTKNRSGTGVLDHQFVPTDDGHGVLGSESKRWKEICSTTFLLPSDGYLRIRNAGENVKAQLSASMLEFGAGGGVAPDTYLQRAVADVLELKALLLQPAGDNVTELGSESRRFKKIYVADFALGSNLLPSADDAYDVGAGGETPKRWRDLYLSGAIKALAQGVAVSLLPNAANAYDLGSADKKWSNLYVNGVGDLGWLNVATYTIITSSRVLQNVTADAAIITSGQFPLARLPRGTGGYVLEAQGASYDPMFVDPNGRYTPASHTHSHASLTGVGADDHHARDHNHAGESLSPNSISVNTLNVATSVNCQNWLKSGDYLFANDFRMTEAEKLGFPKGLAFLNNEGKVLMVLDEEGNLSIAGRIVRLQS